VGVTGHLTGKLDGSWGLSVAASDLGLATGRLTFPALVAR